MHFNLQELLNFSQSIGQICKRQMKINIPILQRMHSVNNFHVLETVGENDLVLLILLLTSVRAETTGVHHLLASNLRILDRQVST